MRGDLGQTGGMKKLLGEEMVVLVTAGARIPQKPAHSSDGYCLPSSPTLLQDEDQKELSA